MPALSTTPVRVQHSLMPPKIRGVLLVSKGTGNQPAGYVGVKTEGVMQTPKQLRENAENCAELAAKAPDEPDRARYQRMEKAWKSLAETQEWLDGKPVNSGTETERSNQ